MAKTQELPSRATLLDVVKNVIIPNTYDRTEEIKKLEAEYNKLKSRLLADKRLTAINKQIEKLKKQREAEIDSKRSTRRSLLLKVKLATVTPALVAEVRKFAGVK